MATVRSEIWGFRVDPGVEMSSELMIDIAEDECSRVSRLHDGAFVRITRNPVIGRNEKREHVMFWEVVYVDYGGEV